MTFCQGLLIWGRLSRNTGAVLGESRLKVADDGRRTLLPCREARSGIEAADVGFDMIEFTDALHAIYSDRRRAGAGDLHQFAPGVS